MTIEFSILGLRPEHARLRTSPRLTLAPLSEFRPDSLAALIAMSSVDSYSEVSVEEANLWAFCDPDFSRIGMLDGRPVGVSLSVGADSEGHAIAGYFGVLPHYRNSPVPLWFASAMVELAISRGARFIGAHVDDRNAAALRLWEWIGFKRLGLKEVAACR